MGADLLELPDVCSDGHLYRARGDRKVTVRYGRRVARWVHERGAVEKRGNGREEERAWPGRDVALSFLILVAQSRRSEADPVGRGTYRVLSGTAVGGELRHGEQPGTRRERLVHLSAFPVERG